MDWSAILGIRFEGRVPPSERISDSEAMDILGLSEPKACRGTSSIVLRVRYLRELLEREREEPPTELRCHQWDDQTTVPTPIVGMFWDIDALREYDWGALTYGFYICGLCQETSSFLGF